MGVASITTKYQFYWRIAFWIGALIAMVGGVARTALKEPTDFADETCRLKKILDKSSVSMAKLKDEPILHEKVNYQRSVVRFPVPTSLI